MKTSAAEMNSADAVKHGYTQQQGKELKTDRPLSEKDEVKKAETRTRKALKDHL